MSSQTMMIDSLEPNPVDPLASLLQKVHRVMKKTQAILKADRNEFQKYNFVSAFAVLQEVRPHLISEGLVILPTCDGYKVDPNGNTYVDMRYRVFDIETATSIESCFPGAGRDVNKNGTAEKGLYKSMTGSLKYFGLQTFMLPTFDDPEIGTQEERDFIEETQRPPAQARVKGITRPIDQPTPPPPPPPQLSVPAPQPDMPDILKTLAMQAPQAPATVPNGAPAPDTNAAQISSMVDAALARPVQIPVADAVDNEENPNLVWAKEMSRLVEDSKSSNETIQLWNNAKTPLLKLKTNNSGAYWQLHAMFAAALKKLKEEAR